MNLEVVELENFKCFKALDLPCSPLTVLTGYNAAGKSTALQALLLMAQALQVAANEKQLPLNGELVSLGSEGDVLRFGASSPFFSLGIRTADESVKWTFGSRKTKSIRGLVPLNKADYLNRGYRSTSKRRIWPVSGRAKSPLVSTIRDTVFIGASRALQLETFPVPRTPVHPEGDVGTRGEYAAYWYLEYADEKVDEARRHPQNDRETVRTQVDAWLDELFPSAKVSADRMAADAPVRLTFSVSKSNPWARPANVGFGLSYTFPMLIALLTRPSGSIVVIDSAESHLHPRAQSAVGRLLGRMAGAGLQIFIETHSDHLLSGIRLAVKEGLLKSEDVALHFFGQDGNVGQVTTLMLDRNGAVSDWPEGFFDQIEHDLAILSGWK